MKLNKTGEAGAAESGDILVTVAPAEEPGLQIELSGKSVILKQFGRQIRELIRKTRPRKTAWKTPGSAPRTTALLTAPSKPESAPPSSGV